MMVCTVGNFASTFVVGWIIGFLVWPAGQLAWHFLKPKK